MSVSIRDSDDMLSVILECPVAAAASLLQSSGEREGFYCRSFVVGAPLPANVVVWLSGLKDLDSPAIFRRMCDLPGFQGLIPGRTPHTWGVRRSEPITEDWNAMAYTTVGKQPVTPYTWIRVSGPPASFGCAAHYQQAATSLGLGQVRQSLWRHGKVWDLQIANVPPGWGPGEEVDSSGEIVTWEPLFRQPPPASAHTHIHPRQRVRLPPPAEAVDTDDIDEDHDVPPEHVSRFGSCGDVEREERDMQAAQALAGTAMNILPDAGRASHMRTNQEEDGQGKRKRDTARQEDSHASAGNT
jgi:hypothetical protein